MQYVPFLTTLFLAAYVKENDGAPPKNPLISSNRIIGGENAKPNELPYQLAFELEGGVVCGASLIHPQWALTAAHCTDELKANEITIIGGEHLLDKGEGHEQRRAVSQIIMHEEYNLGTKNPNNPTVANDVALLKLEKPMDINKWVQVVPMATESHKAKGLVLVSGWGDLKYQAGKGSNKLMKVALPLVDNSKCAEAYKKMKPFTITEKHLCAGLLGEGGKDSCQGDSGGPLVEKHGNNFLLVGVVSAGFECALAKYPGVFSSVAAYRPWIDSKIK